VFVIKENLDVLIDDFRMWVKDDPGQNHTDLDRTSGDFFVGFLRPREFLRGVTERQRERELCGRVVGIVAAAALFATGSPPPGQHKPTK